jgi:hypothetical protein
VTGDASNRQPKLVRKLVVTANTYTHVLTDETELDYGVLLG